MYSCETWTVKNAECQRIDVFQLWCWRRLLRIPWTARRSNQSILRDISPAYSQEGLMLKLKLQDFGHMMQTDDSLENSLMLGKSKGWKWRGHQRMRWLNWITNAMNMNLGKLRETVRGREARYAAWGPQDHIDITGQLNSNNSAYMLNSRVILYSLHIFFSQFWTSTLFHVQF